VLKFELAKKLGAADIYVELSRSNPEVQFEQLKKDHPYGFGENIQDWAENHIDSNCRRRG
jgi:hypothetical protein